MTTSINPSNSQLPIPEEPHRCPFIRTMRWCGKVIVGASPYIFAGAILALLRILGWH